MWEIAVIAAVFIVFIYSWLTWNYDHWKKLNIPCLEPELIFGNIKDFVLMRKCRGLVYYDLYRKSNEPALGVYKMRQPQLLVRDPAFAKLLFINEFSNFRENDVYVEKSDFFLTTNLFFYCGHRWKRDRNIITPALTTLQLRQFVPQMVNVCLEMISFLHENPDQSFEAKLFAGMYTTDTAMSCVYGLRSNSFKDPKTEFRKEFDKIFDPTWWNGMKFAIATSFPPIGHFFKIGITPDTFVKFYTSAVKETVDYRCKNNVRRKDFLQFLIDSKEKEGFPDLSTYEMTGLSMNLTTDAIETTSWTLCHMIDLLMRNPEAQARLREEIDERITSLDDITYELLNTLPYLQAFIHESMRIRTPLPLLQKKCTNDCVVTYKERPYKFRRGDRLAISVYSIHMDPQYFPDPNEFRPERFMGKEEPLGFSPFGQGPRACLGKTFSQIQIKILLCCLLKYFEVIPAGALQPVEYDANSTFFLMVKGGIHFKVKGRRFL